MPVDKDFNQVESNSVKTGGPTETSITTTIVNSLVDGEPLADDGETYSTVQDAENNASSWVFVPPGTFSEAISVTTSNLALVGSGAASTIDGGTTGDAVSVEANNVTISDISVQTTGGGGNAFRPIHLPSGNSGCTVSDVVSTDSDDDSIRGNNHTELSVIGTRVENSDGGGINLGPRGICSGCLALSPGQNSGPANNDGVFSNTIIQNSGNRGFGAGGTDSIGYALRVINSSDDGIQVFGGISNFIVANCRVSGSGVSSIDDGGTGTILDGNLTG